jgi:Lrp/AsnC family leucine-responsive transcriptional regulator
MLLDAMDIRILECVQEDARLTNVEMSQKVNLSATQCHRRLKRMEEQGLIDRYSAILDMTAIGLDVMAMVNVTLESHHENPARSFVREIQRLPEILECWSVAGDADYQLRVAATDLKAFSKFIMDSLMPLPMVASVRSRILLEEVKRSRALPLDHLRVS